MRRPDFGVCDAIEQNAHCTETLQTAMDRPAKFFTHQNYRSHDGPVAIGKIKLFSDENQTGGYKQRECWFNQSNN